MLISKDIPLLGTYASGTRTGKVVTAVPSGAVAISSLNVKEIFKTVIKGVVKLVLIASAKSTLDGSNYISVTGLQYSVDGSNYLTLQDFAPVDVNAVGHFNGPVLTLNLPLDVTHLKIVSAETGSADFTFYVGLRLELPQG